ncbi:MAG: Ig-like domain-containing protein, partial [Gammaproteobacteria bacterium]
NYWVDVLFTDTTGPDTTPPTVTATVPVNGAADVGINTNVTATFSEAVDPATLTGTTFELRDGGGVLVPATVSYDAATRTASLTPNAALSLSTAYSATVKGGVDGVKDLAGNGLAADVPWAFTTVASDPCAAAPNEIARENCQTGNPPSEWDISGAGDASIQGFATDISVNAGESVSFKIDTNASDYRLDIYRIGYYAGQGARKIATVSPSVALPQTQPSCLTNATGLVDCGNWAVSASWAVPSDATSGIYFAKAVREDTGGASHIVFIVRDDTGGSDILFQTADTTWQAYNTYGGNSLYTGSGPGTGGGADGRAYKVSYNRPFNTRSVDGGQDWLFNAEYPMVRWLEANGYDVSYFTGVDSDRFGSLIQNHKVFLSVGHDEYWSGAQRANVEAARDAGVHLAFFSGNEVFWKTRWENSIDGAGSPYRTLVCYKETHNYPNNQDPEDPPIWTGTWRDPRNSPPADGGQPENALMGPIFTVNDGATGSIQVRAEDGKMRFWRNTDIANLSAGATATLPFGTLGYEWDEDLDNGFRPDGLIRMSTTTVENAPVLVD